MENMGIPIKRKTSYTTGILGCRCVEEKQNDEMFVPAATNQLLGCPRNLVNVWSVGYNPNVSHNPLTNLLLTSWDIQVMVNSWFGARWFGFRESSKMKGIGIVP